MPFALLLALIAIASATLLTYLYDRDASFPARLCAGTCTGFAALGLVGFIVASMLGLNAASLLVTGTLIAAPLLMLGRREWRARVGADIAELLRVVRLSVVRPGKGETGTLIFYLVAALLFWFVFGGAMYENPAGVFTGVDNNIGDLPFHLSIITGFAHGANFPPQDTEFAGVRLTYPFIIDFLAAMFVRAGASLQGALFWQNFVLALSLVGLLHRWALKLTDDRAAALITPALVLLSGGFGWTELFADAQRAGRGVFELLGQLPHDYTIMGHINYRWGNAVTTLLIPQRGLLLGIPLALVVWTLWWDGAGDERRLTGDGEETHPNEGSVEELTKVRKKRRAGKLKLRGGDEAEKRSISKAEKRHVTKSAHLDAPSPSTVSRPMSALLRPPSAVVQMLAAGIVAGMLPLVHAHSFVVMMLMGGCLALIFADWKGANSGSSAGGFAWSKLFASSRPWVAFFVAACLVAVPQMLWAMNGSAVHAGQFFGREFGWDHGTANVFWFWLKNTGLFIPLLAAALLWRGRASIVPRRLLLFYLPFVLCFVIPNLFKLSPWVWDNIKVLFYWWVASAPLVALLLARLWRGGKAWRACGVAALLVLTLAG
ncbi:MAG: hypothetical protein WCD76_02420, partial [Pyrinomonadaceae bacterium]